MKSWLNIAADTEFSMYNFPFTEHADNKNYLLCL
jgi:hypothetical protein